MPQPLSALAPRQAIDGPAQCVVSAQDYGVHWEGQTPVAPDYRPPVYAGPERRLVDRDRRWVSAGGRRRHDRKQP